MSRKARVEGAIRLVQPKHDILQDLRVNRHQELVIMTDGSKDPFLFERLGLGSNPIVEQVVVEKPARFDCLCHQLCLRCSRIESELVSDQIPFCSAMYFRIVSE